VRILVIATTGNGNNQQLPVAKRQDGVGSKTIALLDKHPRNCPPVIWQGKRQDGVGSKTIALLDKHPRNCPPVIWQKPGFMEQ